MFTVNTAIYSEHEGYQASETQTLGENMAVKTQDNFEWDYRQSIFNVYCKYSNLFRA